MQIIDGRKLAARIRAEVKEEIARLGSTPGLAVILVGKDPASHLYVALKEKACTEAGIKFEKYVFSGTEPESEIIETIRKLNGRDDIHGILVQVPLPAIYHEDVILSTLDPSKDVDGFHQVNLRAILEGKPRIIPCVALAIVALVDEAIKQKGDVSLFAHKKGDAPFLAVLIANRMEFAAPLEYLLEKRGALVQIILRAKEVTTDISAQIKSADILIVARGHANFVSGDMIKDGAIVIDVGTNTLPDGKVVGDVDQGLALSKKGLSPMGDKPGYITPVPGGVGPMTVAMLLKNTLELAKNA
ncbi:hypothetical protein A3B21_00625 [Candidatus Uhrbacteria bacterium RIFCSPLOWO2_01_FULL_47_24]|uniref:Bifunctional protein FolD n=1 Tax=Candidatus Uhrbacteria bacterium RIFCSPLOWO2_01_FULL_47_24 TaxID=1802401 RepID=A0A1F7UNL6_9BACT|nr:MAG: hypothetical protein A2753_04795 [Candidatus Uhrbacteria bacterium RIFCSPHIGHO2_01_FULL_47_11]OGL67676.1 MAG: hypothetical protein A3D58_04515 [Candidatus Uhrbacteria bacterium RIFCSPHIGHO2_02_FULL_46_47]OGL74859.1 MAG: hypothetical protein A3F52_00280 [Candidatus Uhrbacteria bacterium RIFCSPHIGHO2_12_FULL_47_11]OGL79881.1 MAG: hypothetical protein A3B21_00625 [Candidatus Uhrbacteria bacterium RIFCSPLOWO2_01_FULL_47_24]OGL84101.1 MAG: hypothetical protein A3J03_03420 [Candidatus Uhrbact